MLLESYAKGKRTLEIFLDELPSSPREDDNLGTLVYGHRRYVLGEEEAWNVDDYTNWTDWKKGELGDAIALPVYLYDHSGLSVSTNRHYPFDCPWDSGQLGWIYVSRAKAREWLGYKRISKQRERQVLEYLQNEVKVFDAYLRGEVYGYILYEDGKEIDSCWGFYTIEDILEDTNFKEVA